MKRSKIVQAANLIETTDQIQQALSRIGESSDHVSNILFLFKEKEKEAIDGPEFLWLKREAELASPVVFHVLFQRLTDVAKREKIRFLGTIANSYTFSVALGHIYEDDCIEALGGNVEVTCNVKALGSSEVETTTLPARQQCKYRVKELTEELQERLHNQTLLGTLFVPMIFNQGSFDSFAMFETCNGYCVEIYQMTISRKHPVIRRFVTDLINTLRVALGRPITLRFIFVVPRYTFGNFNAHQDGAYAESYVMQWDDETIEEHMQSTLFNDDLDPTEPNE
jgi:hypothetical protein